MTPPTLTVLTLIVGTLTTYAGLFCHRRLSVSYSFLAYLAAILISESLMYLWPETFWTREFWHRKQLAVEVAKLGIFVECGWRMTTHLPAARRTLAAAVTLAAVLATLSPGGLWDPTVQTLPILLVALAVLYVRARYSLTVHPFAYRVLLGHVLYMGAFGALFRYFGNPYLLALAPAAYVGVVWFWTVSAWRAYSAEQPYLEARRRIEAWA